MAFCSPSHPCAPHWRVRSASSARQPKHSREHPERAVRVRIGINTGEVIRTNDDVAGQAVIAAARIMACAEPGEILVSRVVKDLSGTLPDVTFEPRGLVALKGFPEPWQLHAVTVAGHGGRRPDPDGRPTNDALGAAELVRRTRRRRGACRCASRCLPDRHRVRAGWRWQEPAGTTCRPRGRRTIRRRSHLGRAQLAARLGGRPRRARRRAQAQRAGRRRTLGSDRRGARRAQPTDRVRQLRALGRSSGCSGRVHRGRGRSGRPPADEPGTVAGGRRARIDTGPAG